MISEIYENFQIEKYDFMERIFEKIDIDNIDNILCNILNIITIIPISIVFVAIRKRSNILYALFYISSLIEVVIILYRLWISCSNYFIYHQIYYSETFSTVSISLTNQYILNTLINLNVKRSIDNDILFRWLFFIGK